MGGESAILKNCLFSSDNNRGDVISGERFSDNDLCVHF